MSAVLLMGADESVSHSYIELKSGSEDNTWAIAFSPDGKKIVTINHGRISGSRPNFSPDNPTFRIWDAASGKELKKFEGHTGFVGSVAFSPDGKKFVTGSWDKTARIWDAESGKELKKLEGHKDAVKSVAFSPDGKKILMAKLRAPSATRILDAESKRVLQMFSFGVDVKSAVFSSDGKKIVISPLEEKFAYIFDAASGKELRKIDRGISKGSPVAFSPDGKKIVALYREKFRDGKSICSVRIWILE